MPRPSSIAAFKRNTARRLRENATDAENRLWRRLKRLELRGTHFRQQMPLGDFVVDFACPAARLVIEVDGSQHGEERTRVRDETRTRWLQSQGYRVLRFWNNEVAQDIGGVMEAIYAGLYGSREVEPRALKHRRRRRSGEAGAPTPPRRATELGYTRVRSPNYFAEVGYIRLRLRADPPPPGEGED